MKRYFVALIPPAEIQAYAIDIIQSLRDRYGTETAKAPPHVTLAPPFQWPPAEIDRLEARLAEFGQHQTAIDVEIAGFGAFAPRVLYLNVVRSPALLELQADLTVALRTDLGIVDRHESRPFAPHLTVASRHITRLIFRQAWAELEPRSIEFSFWANAIALLVHDGQQWRMGRQFPLAEPA